MPAQHGGMAVDIELPALDHQALGRVQHGLARQIQPLVKAAALLVDADAAPEGQGRLFCPGENRRDCPVQQGKFSHD